jgi:4-amino-4-deoxy-L-arabinose transferase-like glycosyltransferase
VGVPVGLYVVSAAMLLFAIGSHPDFTYNWENNTADGLFTFMANPTVDIFHLTEGLMTDSGKSPLVVLPAWLGFALTGENLASMRWPVALIAAGAVPLLWLVGKRLAGMWTGVLAALLLALSPVFLLYARTATVVGLSLVPMLLTMYVLLRLLERPESVGWVVALQGTLVLGAYAYAPVRFLWPFSVGLLVWEAFLRKEQRKRLLACAALTVVVVTGTIVALDYAHEHDFVMSVGYYYAGRGEQVANLLASKEDYAKAVGIGDQSLPPTMEFFAQVVGQNTLDLVKLLVDYDTQPAITDYWNQHGRLITVLLVPFFLIGFGRTVWLARRRDAYDYRMVALFFLGFTLPMVFTSKVHIGRLIFALPLICLMTAVGVAYCLFLRAYRGLRVSPGDDGARRLVGSLVVVLLLLVAATTWSDYSVEVPTTREARITQELIKDAPAVKREGAYVALVAVDDPTLVLEEIDANQYRLGLKDYYCFYDLSNGQGTPCTSDGGNKPTLLVGAMLQRMKEPARIPQYCTNIYYVSPDLLEKFTGAAREHQGQCAQPLRYKLLKN